jgi:hypothetical protein
VLPYDNARVVVARNEEDQVACHVHWDYGQNRIVQQSEAAESDSDEKIEQELRPSLAELIESCFDRIVTYVASTPHGRERLVLCKQASRRENTKTRRSSIIWGSNRVTSRADVSDPSAGFTTQSPSRNPPSNCCLDALMASPTK